MSRKVVTFEQLFEVVREANQIKLDSGSHFLHSTWMNVTVRESLLVQKFDRLHYRVKCLNSFACAKLTFAIVFPLIYN